MSERRFLFKRFVKSTVSSKKPLLLESADGSQVILPINDRSREIKPGVYRIEAETLVNADSHIEALEKSDVVLRNALNLLSAYTLKPSWIDETVGSYLLYDSSQIGKRRKFVYAHIVLKRFIATPEKGYMLRSGISTRELEESLKKELDPEIINSMNFLRFGLRGEFAREAFIHVTSAIEAAVGKKEIKSKCSSCRKNLTCKECGKKQKRTVNSYDELEKYGFTKSEISEILTLRGIVSHGDKLTNDQDKRMSELLTKMAEALSRIYRDTLGWRSNLVHMHKLKKESFIEVRQFETRYPSGEFPKDLPNLSETIPDFKGLKRLSADVARKYFRS